MSITKEKFQQLVKECLVELKEAAKDPRERLKESLRPMVEQVLGEIANVGKLENDKDELEKVRRGGFEKTPLHQKDGGPERLDIVNNEKEEELRKIVNDINKEWEVYWDDHNDLVINAQNQLKVRIVPKFENNFDIDAYIKLVDRVRAIGLTWEQVKEFVKANFKDIGNKTNADKLKEKSLANKVDHDDKKAAGPDHDKIKPRYIDPENKSVGDTKNKNKDYNEKAVEKEEDQPDQPMKDVGKLKDLNKNIDKTSKVKPPKHEDNKTLRPADKKTAKLRSRK